MKVTFRGHPRNLKQKKILILMQTIKKITVAEKKMTNLVMQVCYCYTFVSSFALYKVSVLISLEFINNILEFDVYESDHYLMTSLKEEERRIMNGRKIKNNWKS